MKKNVDNLTDLASCLNVGDLVVFGEHRLTFEVVQITTPTYVESCGCCSYFDYDYRILTLQRPGSEEIEVKLEWDVKMEIVTIEPLTSDT